MFYNKKTVLMISAALLIAGCTPTTVQRGNMLKDSQIAKVEEGVHTRSDVAKLLGSPTTVAPFNEDIWYYIGQETEKSGILDPEVVQERIVAVTYNDQGVVENVADIDNERLNIPVEGAVTKTHGNDLTVMQQLLGNLGRFNPQDAQ